jgi:hypothetical protein
MKIAKCSNYSADTEIPKKTNTSTLAGFRKGILLHKACTGCCLPTKQINVRRWFENLPVGRVFCIPEVVCSNLDVEFHYYEKDFSWLPQLQKINTGRVSLPQNKLRPRSHVRNSSFTVIPIVDCMYSRCMVL